MTMLQNSKRGITVKSINQWLCVAGLLATVLVNLNAAEDKTNHLDRQTQDRPDTSAFAVARSEVVWPEFLEGHDLVWTEAPQAWHDGPFMGNGMLGTMLHQLDKQTLRISLGRADVEDHKKTGSSFISQSRLPNG